MERIRSNMVRGLSVCRVMDSRIRWSHRIWKRLKRPFFIDKYHVIAPKCENSHVFLSLTHVMVVCPVPLLAAVFFNLEWRALHHCPSVVPRYLTFIHRARQVSHGEQNLRPHSLRSPFFCIVKWHCSLCFTVTCTAPGLNAGMSGTMTRSRLSQTRMHVSPPLPAGGVESVDIYSLSAQISNSQSTKKPPNNRILTGKTQTISVLIPYSLRLFCIGFWNDIVLYLTVNCKCLRSTRELWWDQIPIIVDYIRGESWLQFGRNLFGQHWISSKNTRGWGIGFYLVIYWKGKEEYWQKWESNTTGYLLWDSG